MARGPKSFDRHVDVVLPTDDVDLDKDYLLTEEEKQEIEDEVRAEIEAARIAVEKAAFRKELKRRLRVEAGLEHAQIQVTIDLAGHSSKIVLDGREYHQGFSYVVPKPVYETLADIMQRTWQHEGTVGGANRDEYRKPRHTVVSNDNQVVNAPSRQNRYAPKVVFPAQNTNTRASLHGE